MGQEMTAGAGSPRSSPLKRSSIPDAEAACRPRRRRGATALACASAGCLPMRRRGGLGRGEKYIEISTQHHARNAHRPPRLMRISYIFHSQLFLRDEAPRTATTATGHCARWRLIRRKRRDDAWMRRFWPPSATARGAVILAGDERLTRDRQR